MWNKNNNDTLTPEFSCIETILVQEDSIPLLSYHLQRIRESITQLSWPDGSSFLEAIQKELSLFQAEGDKVWRLEWKYENSIYQWAWTNRENPPKAIESWQLKPVQISYDFEDIAINLKTTHRQHYENAFQQKGNADDVLLFNQKGYITETSIANLFFLKDEQWHTPALNSGCVKGTYRTKFIEDYDVIIRAIHLEELSSFDAIYMCNSIRGFWEAYLI